MPVSGEGQISYITRICIFLLSLPHCGNNSLVMTFNHPFYGRECKHLTTIYPPKNPYDIFTNAGISERHGLQQLFVTV